MGGKMKINAWAVKMPRGNLEKFIYEKKINPFDVLISIKYCSFTRGDIGFIDNFWGDTSYPLVPGYEIFGVIKDKGNKVQDFKIEDFVGVGYQVSSCFKCEYCKSGKEQFCKKQRLICVNEYGGLADYIVTDSHFAFKIPPELQKPSYVPLMCSGLTVYSAIKKAGSKPGMRVGVIGIGNLGHLAVQILNKMGCEVTVFTHSKNKIQILRKLGIKHFVDSTDKKSLEREKRKYDIIFNTSTALLDWPVYIGALKEQGSLMLIGLPAKDVCFPAVLLADYAQRGVLGSYIGSRSEMNELLSFASKHNIKALIGLFPSNQIESVVSKVRKGEIPFSSVIEI